MPKPIVAMMYDFDKTLCTKDMQEYGFIPSLGMDAGDFWSGVTQLTDAQQMDSILAYMYQMVEKARERQIPVTRETFEQMGAGVQFFDGVRTWFERVNRYGEEIGVQIEHYIVSSGIKEIIEGTEIARYFKKIYACEFMYGEDGSIRWPKFAVNYTAKTQFLFRINKGVLEIDSASAGRLNEYTPEENRRVPFRNMIYIGDGITDVPCMRLVKSYGGQSIAVYDRERGSADAERLRAAGRVNYVVPADYSEGSRIETIVKAILKKMQAEAEMRAYAEA